MLALALKNHLRLLSECVRPGPTSQGRLTPKRVAVLLAFIPAYTVIQSINATGLALDRVLFPGFRKVSVKRPVFVLGMPRSGTTFLHRLLAGDSKRFSTTQLWELIVAPSITQRFLWMSLGRLDRILGRPAGRLLAVAEKGAFGWFGDVHPTRLQDAEEDFLALSLIGACFLFIIPFPFEKVWRLAYFDEQLSPDEQRQVMAFYYGLIQRHLYVHGTDRRFLSKNPSFTPMIRALARTFPDAQFIACFRDPQAAAPSLVSSLQDGARLFGHKDPKATLGRQLITMLRFYGRHLLATLPQLKRDQYALITMEDLTSDPKAQTERLYARLGWPISTEYTAVLSREKATAGGFQSRHRYSMARLGLDEATIEQELGFLREKVTETD